MTSARSTWWKWEVERLLERPWCDFSSFIFFFFTETFIYVANMLGGSVLQSVAFYCAVASFSACFALHWLALCCIVLQYIVLLKCITRAVKCLPHSKTSAWFHFCNTEKPVSPRKRCSGSVFCGWLLTPEPRWKPLGFRLMEENQARIKRLDRKNYLLRDNRRAVGLSF